MATPEPPKYGSGPIVELPHASTFTEAYEYRGSSRVMADGTLATDLVDASVQRLFEITWTNVTSANKTTITTFVTTLAGGSSLFRPPQESGGTTEYTVTRDEELSPITWTMVRNAAGEFLWSTSIILREA